MTTEQPTLTVRRGEASDLSQLMELLRGKAEFDGGLHLLRATRAELEEAFFGTPPRCEVLVADDAGELLGFATFFPTFSTYLARPGLWLDDLFVKADRRSRGIGGMLVRELSRIADRRACARIEWSVATGNRRGIAFYEGFGARLREDGRLARLDAEAIAKLASA